jgi:hypothetical protein
MPELVTNSAWVVGAALLGFLLAAFFAGVLELRRRVYLLVYIPLAGGFSLAFFQWNSVDLPQLILENLWWGLLGAMVVGALGVKNVLSQPTSPRNSGTQLVVDILWPGVAYGAVDALLLSVLPVLAIISSFPDTEGDGGQIHAVLVGSLALVASLFVTATYHLGYEEFRRPRALMGALVGNGVFSLAFLLTGNPLAAVLPHISMHVMAMVHGKDTTLQLPPHDPRTHPSALNR